MKKAKINTLNIKSDILKKIENSVVELGGVGIVGKDSSVEAGKNVNNLGAEFCNNFGLVINGRNVNILRVNYNKFKDLKCKKDYKVLKDKAIAVRETEDNLQKLREDSKVCADKFIERYSQSKLELDKITSWLGPGYTASDLVKIIGVTSSMEPLDRETRFALIKRNLINELNKSENYSDKRLMSAISTLNQYENFINNLDSLDLKNNSNHLNTDKYLISLQLHYLLVKGYSYRDWKIKEMESGIYMVVFKL